MHISKSEHFKLSTNFYMLETNSIERRSYCYFNSNYLLGDKILLTKKYEIIGSQIRDFQLENSDIDDNIILHIPTSFFTIDNRIPKKLRELINEAEKCVKNNCLTGSSACIRKTIYEF